MTVNLNRGVCLVNELFFRVFKAFLALLLLPKTEKSTNLVPELPLAKSLS
jgi:hypothetical protein